MKLKYVGAKPIISKRGVSFDQTKPDRYTFIKPALEVLTAFDEVGVDENGILDMSKWSAESIHSDTLEKALEYCDDLEKLAKEQEEKTAELIKEYERKIKESENLKSDEKSAWLGNIKIMKSYYMQYIANELVYDCILDRIADKITGEHVYEIYFPLQRDYGLVLSHLIPVLTDHRPPLDATLVIEEKNGETYGKFDTNKSKPLK